MPHTHACPGLQALGALLVLVIHAGLILAAAMWLTSFRYHMAISSDHLDISSVMEVYGSPSSSNPVQFLKSGQVLAAHLCKSGHTYTASQIGALVPSLDCFTEAVWCAAARTQTASFNCAGLHMRHRVLHNKVLWCVALQAGSSSSGTCAPGLPLSQQCRDQRGR